MQVGGYVFQYIDSSKNVCMDFESKSYYFSMSAKYKALKTGKVFKLVQLWETALLQLYSFIN